MTDASPSPTGLVRDPHEDIWKEAWASADLPDTDREAWRDAMSYRTNTPVDAVGLAALDLTPSQVVQARTSTRLYGSPFDRRKLADWPITRLAAHAALANETAQFHDFYREVALSERGVFVQALAERPTEAWTFDKIGALIGVTKQRARVIARNGARLSRPPRWSMSAARSRDSPPDIGDA